jgi:hypothetical protein
MKYTISRIRPVSAEPTAAAGGVGQRQTASILAFKVGARRKVLFLFYALASSTGHTHGRERPDGRRVHRAPAQ